MTETFRIRVVPSTPDGKLDVEDAMQQVLDMLALLKSGSSDPDGLGWKLERASTNSPFDVVAVAYSLRPEVNAVALAREEKRAAASGLESLARGEVPSWMGKQARDAAKRMMARNLNGIAQTSLATDDETPPLEISTDQARAAVGALDRSDLAAGTLIPAHMAYGEIEGRLSSVGDYNRKPAVWLKSKVHGVVPCIVNDAELERIGGRTTLDEVWQSRPIRVRGRLHYKQGGALERISADTLEKLDLSPISVDEVITRGFTSGLDPADYISKLRDGSLG